MTALTYYQAPCRVESDCRLTFRGKSYRVAAVIDKKEEILMLPTKEGKAETVIFMFQDRARVKERLEALGFCWSSS